MHNFHELVNLVSSEESNSSDLHIVEDDCLVLKIPPSLINNYNECVTQFYRKIYHKYNAKYGGICLAIDPYFRIYETFGHSFQDNHCLYLRTCVRMIVFSPHIGSIYRVKVSRIFPRDIIATLHGFVIVNIPVDFSNADIQKISVDDDLTVSVTNTFIEWENIRLEATIIEHISQANVKTENMENGRCVDECQPLSNVDEPHKLTFGRKRKNAD